MSDNIGIVIFAIPAVIAVLIAGLLIYQGKRQRR